MTLVGVTGLPCSGKSFAAALIANGAVDGEKGVLLKADNIGHEILTRHDVVARLRERFGNAAFAHDEPAAVRRAIAERVFSRHEDLLWLESVVHPLVSEELDRTAAQYAGTETRVIVEAAMLFATSLEMRCDRVLLVEAPFETRLVRAALRGWDANELRRRELRQRPLIEEALQGPAGEKIRRVENDGDKELLRKRLLAALAPVSLY